MKCRPHSSKSTLYLLVTYLDKIYNPHSLEEYIPSNRLPKSCLVLTRNIYISHKMSVFHLSRYIVSNLFKLRPYSCKMVSIFRPSLLRLPGFNLMNLALLKIYGLGISWTSLFMIMYHVTIYLFLTYFNLEILDEQNFTIFLPAVVLNLFLSQLLFLTWFMYRALCCKVAALKTGGGDKWLTGSWWSPLRH